MKHHRKTPWLLHSYQFTHWGGWEENKIVHFELHLKNDALDAIMHSLDIKIPHQTPEKSFQHFNPDWIGLETNGIDAATSPSNGQQKQGTQRWCILEGHTQNAQPRLSGIWSDHPLGHTVPLGFQQKHVSISKDWWQFSPVFSICLFSSCVEKNHFKLKLCRSSGCIVRQKM